MKISIVAALCLLFPSITSARDDGRYAQADPEIKKWIEGLTDRNGRGCCAHADGSKPDDITWDMTDGYRVMILGEWYKVPDDALVRGPNRLGAAIVWYFIDSGKVHIRCFLPGTGI